MSGEIRLLVQRYHDGQLDAAGEAGLASLIRGAGPEAEAARRELALLGLLAQALRPLDDSGFQRSLDERLRARREDSRLVRRVQGALPRRRPALRLWLPLAAAAGLLLALGLGWALHLRSGASDVQLALAGDARLLRDGGTADPVGGMRIGDRVEAGSGSAELRLDGGGTRLLLSAGTIARTAPAAFALDAGNVQAEVAHQPPGRSLVIATPVVQVQVIGTRFSLGHGADGSHLEVADGEVRLVGADGTGCLVQGGFTADCRAPGRYQLTDRAMLAANGGKGFAAAALFGRDLDGWRSSAGNWRRDGAAVLGEGAAARLESAAAFADVLFDGVFSLAGTRRLRVEFGGAAVELEAGTEPFSLVAVRLGGRLRVATTAAAVRVVEGAAGAGPIAFVLPEGGRLRVERCSHFAPGRR